MLDMKRREFIALLGAGGLLLAVKVRRTRAQQPAMPVIGCWTTDCAGFVGKTPLTGPNLCRRFV
jgi:hypothetical protein